MRILNLTQHAATPDQVAVGVIEPADKRLVQALVTFDELPSAGLIYRRAEELARYAKAAGAKTAMIGGAPFFMAPLEVALRAANITPLYAFSKRVSADERQPDGSVKKTQVFKHAGFVLACDCGDAGSFFPSETRDSFSGHRLSRVNARRGVLIGGANDSV